MARRGEEQVGYGLVKTETLTLRGTDRSPAYISIVVCQDKIVVIDGIKVQIYLLHDGKFLAASDRLESKPRDMCLMDSLKMCVLHDDGLINMMSIDFKDMSHVFRTTSTLRLRGVFDEYHGIVRFKDSLVVSGAKQGRMYWCIVSSNDGHVNTSHQICKGDRWSCLTTKDNMIYISCHAGVKSTNTGVYGFDILNPNQCKYTYKHQRLQWPRSIVINEDWNIFVCDFGLPYTCIHQLTVSFQLVAIFTKGIPRYPSAMYWDHGRLYATCDWSNDITVLQPVNQGRDKDSESQMINEGKKAIDEETSIEIGHANTEKEQPSVEIEMPTSLPVHENPEDKQGSHEASEVLVSDERKHPVIEETATQIGQENVDRGQLDVKKEMPPSGPSLEDCQDERQVGHKASEVPLSDERKQPVSEDTSTLIVQEISIEQRVEETLDRAEIQMSTEEKDLFLRFQREIGTTLYFSGDQASLNDAKKNLDTTESFLKNHNPDTVDKWLEYRDQGKLTPELIDIIYAEKRNQKLHETKDFFLNKMEQLNIIARARSFNENGVKEENYFFTPCVLRKESPKDVITPAKDPRMVSTSVLCWVITGKFLLPAIFQKLIAACLARWPVAKKKETLENLIFQDCTVFDLDLIHRLFLHCKNQAVFARITRMGIDKVNTKICTRVRKFITINLSEIISNQDLNSKYMLCVQNAESQDIPEDIRSLVSPPCEMWFMDEVHDPNAPITREHMNHARLCVALVTVCGNAMRAILLANISAPHTNIYQAILANKAKLTSRTQDGSGKWQNALLNKDQCKMLFPDPKHRYVTPIDQYDISLLYTLIRNVSTVKRPSTDWGVDPQDSPRDKSLGANVERIRLYRNKICGHSVDGQISQHDFEDYWNKIDSVLHDIDSVIGGQVYSQELKKQKRQVISVYEAC